MYISFSLLYASQKARAEGVEAAVAVDRRYRHSVFDARR